MITVEIPLLHTHAAWRNKARSLLISGFAPEQVTWKFEGAPDDLFQAAVASGDGDLAPTGAPPPSVPPLFLELADDVICHNDSERFGRLYAMLWRLRATAGLLQQRFDPDVARLFEMQAQVRREAHKMKAFVRFREIPGDGARRRFAAWFEPEHLVVEKTAPFFARRFADMDWVIATPVLTASCVAGNLCFAKTVAPAERLTDVTEELWRIYFSSIFNPARVKIAAMKREMPVRYWKNMPETVAIPKLIAGATRRTDVMRQALPSQPPAFARKAVAPMIDDDTRHEAAINSEKPPQSSLDDLRGAARSCTRCPLFAKATQTVFGEGSPKAELVFVGEQPGDKEDLAGRPFVGPAGQLFDDCLAEAEIALKECYVTNAVKHFKYEPRGKIRLHKKPNTSEITRCKWWLAGELAIVRPKLVVALGATAAQALTGSGDGILKRRGKIEATSDGLPLFITVHPSSLLRIPTPEGQREGRALFVADLKAIKATLNH